MKLLNILFGDPNEKVIKNLQAEVLKINALEKDWTALSDEALRLKRLNSEKD